MVQVMVAAPQGVYHTLSASTDAFDFSQAASMAAMRSHFAGARPPDLTLLDFDMPGLSGLKGIQSVREVLGDRPLGVLVSGAPLELARRLLTSGADAVLPRDTDAKALESALGLLADGGRFVVFTPDYRPERKRIATALSERELQVLQGICDGMQNKEIAHAFQVQEVTVKMHVRAIIRKLGARNRTQAAMIARDLGIA